MKKKIGTILDEEILYRAKRAALRQRKSLSQILEEALKTYMVFLERKPGERTKAVVRETSGAMKIPHKALKAVMEEEGIYDA